MMNLTANVEEELNEIKENAQIIGVQLVVEKQIEVFCLCLQPGGRDAA